MFSDGWIWGYSPRVCGPLGVVFFSGAVPEPHQRLCQENGWRIHDLAGKDAKPLKTVSTPSFHDERIARPIANESETKGVLAPIATKVLMKIVFAARMACFDLLRAVQGLAARVTKWSTECDKALHRLVCYIHSTLDLKLRAFIGDSIHECKLWCFADADHPGEYDNRSTAGCFLVLVGPNSYFLLLHSPKSKHLSACLRLKLKLSLQTLPLELLGYLPPVCGPTSRTRGEINVMQVWKETHGFLTPVGES